MWITLTRSDDSGGAMGTVRVNTDRINSYYTQKLKYRTLGDHHVTHVSFGDGYPPALQVTETESEIDALIQQQQPRQFEISTAGFLDKNG